MEDWRKIYLFQEDSFYRAYEVSAWLFHQYISQFKITHRHVKGIDQTIVFVGFPVSSLEKRKPENAVVENIAEKHLVIDLKISGETQAVERLNNDFAVWKSLQPVTESKDIADNGKSEAAGKKCEPKKLGVSLFGVAQQVIAYPIETHSPIECMLFLSCSFSVSVSGGC